MSELERLEGQLVPVLRVPERRLLVPLSEALVEGGLGVLEVTTSTPEAVEGIRDLAQHWGDRVLIGLGTALDPETVRTAAEAGARFVVSPVLEETVLAEARRLGLLALPGAFTPTEVLRAWRLGADVVKVFPAGGLGPGYLRDVLAPLPQIRLMPTGGVERGTLATWFGAGAFAVGAGSSLVPKGLVASEDWAGLAAHVRDFLAAG